MKLILYYSVSNGGDGSAHPEWMESAELTEFDQRNMQEGWGECCIGSIELESDSPITHNINITTKENYLFDNFIHDLIGEDIDEFDDDCDLDLDVIEEFIDTFFGGNFDFDITVEKKDFAYKVNKLNFYQFNVYFNGIYAGYNNEVETCDPLVLKQDVEKVFTQLKELIYGE